MAVEIGRGVYGGSFVGAEGELVTFVLPGELVSGGEVVEAAAGRVAPGCVHFGVCGGCQYQHASSPLQLEIKAGILREVLNGVPGLPEVQVHAGDAWGYRNRVRLRVEEAEGQVRVGYSRRGMNEFLPIRMCPISAGVLWRAAEALVRLAQQDALCRRWLAAVSEVELFCTGEEKKVQAQFFLEDAGVTTDRAQGFGEFCLRLKAAVPELMGAGVEMNPELSRRARRGFAGEGWGAAGLMYEIGGRGYWVSRGAFFQVNRFLVGELVGLAAAGRAGGVAWDLFAGVGLFSRVLCEGFGRVIAVEGGEVAAGDLLQAGRKGGFEAVRAPAIEFLKARLVDRERPELVVLDPPRAGLGVEGAGLLARVGAAEIVYVSCDPVTLARDLAVLVKAGYGVRAVHLVDLFPQTFHLETVVVLVRG